MEKTITINGRQLKVYEGMRATEVKVAAGIDPQRMLIARDAHGGFRLVPDRQPLPGPYIFDAPRFIYG